MTQRKFYSRFQNIPCLEKYSFSIFIILMMIFFILLAKTLFGRFMQFAGSQLITTDQQGMVLNKVTCDILNSEPNPPFQNINIDDLTGIITIRTFASPTCINQPTLNFNIVTKLTDLSEGLQLDLSVNHTLLSISGDFDFYVRLHFKEYSSQTYKQKFIMITSTTPPSTGSKMPGNSSYSYSNGVWWHSTLNSNSFNSTAQSVLNISWIVDSLAILKEIQVNDTLTDLSLVGNFRSGSYQTSIKYILTNLYGRIDQQTFMGRNCSRYDFDYQPSPAGFGDYQYLQYPISLGIDDLRLRFVANPAITDQLRPCSGQRIGYYKGSYHISNQLGHDLDYFPLDPALMTKYYIISDHDLDCRYPLANAEALQCFIIFLRRDYNATTNTFTDLNDQGLINQKIQICTINKPALQRGTLVETFTYTDASKGTNCQCSLYEKPNSTSTEPYLYTFILEPSTQSIMLNLFFFVNRLFERGKFRLNERVSQISKCVRLYQGTGKYKFRLMKFPKKSDLSYLQTMRCSELKFGCIVCDTGGSCVICDAVDNWVLENGSCICSSGYVQSTELNKIICKIPAPQLPAVTEETQISSETSRSLSCLLPADNVTEGNCLNARLSIKGNIAITLTSTPYIGAIFKVGQIMAFIDDFTFYIYINATYGREFKKFLYFMWNLSIQRWIPYSFSYFYYDIKNQYDEKTKLKDTSLIPELWTDLDEDSAFINNTLDFWIGSIPFTVTTFLILHLLFRWLKGMNSKYYHSFISFKWFTILSTNIFLQNLQLLSFRSFQQILYGGPPLINQLRLIYFLNRIACFVTLFFVTICACAGQYILRIFIGANIKHAIDLVLYSNQAALFIFVLHIAKVANGFIFASFSVDNLDKMSVLVSIQVALLSIIIYFRSQFYRKSMLTLLIVQFIFKVIINLIIILRVWLKAELCRLSQIEEEELSNIQITMVLTLFVLAGFELLTTFIKEPSQKKLLAKIKFLQFQQLERWKTKPLVGQNIINIFDQSKRKILNRFNYNVQPSVRQALTKQVRLKIYIINKNQYFRLKVLFQKESKF